MTARILAAPRPPRAPRDPQHSPPAGPGLRRPGRIGRAGAAGSGLARRSGAGQRRQEEQRRQRQQEEEEEKKGEKKRHEWGLAPPPGAHGIRRAAAGSRPEPRGESAGGSAGEGPGGPAGSAGTAPCLGLQDSPAKWFWRKKGKRDSGKGLSAPAGPRWSWERSDGSALLPGARGWATCRCRKG